jgi:hypothetical protein
MKTALRIAAALALVAFAAPAFACSEAKPVTASAEKSDASKKQATVAKAEKQATVKTSPAVK